MKRKRLPLLPRTDRACDECHACCSVFAIKALDKPLGETCRHLDPTKIDACTIYADRPRDCQDYRCAWLTDAGFGDTWHRPDRLGVVFTARDNKWETLPFAGLYTLVAHETRSGAFEELGAKKFMKYVAGRFIVLGFHGPLVDKCRAMGPADKLAAAIDWCRERGYDGPTGILRGSRSK